MDKKKDKKPIIALAVFAVLLVLLIPLAVFKVNLIVIFIDIFLMILVAIYGIFPHDFEGEEY